MFGLIHRCALDKGIEHNRGKQFLEIEWRSGLGLDIKDLLSVLDLDIQCGEDLLCFAALGESLPNLPNPPVGMDSIAVLTIFILKLAS